MNEQAGSAELLKFLDSGEIEVVGKIKQVIHENLYSSKDASLLNSLVDSYVQSKSENLLSIITGVNKSQCQYLFDKMNDLLKRGIHADLSSIFVSMIRQQPSWLYKVVDSQFFANYLKSLRTQLVEQDVTFLMSGAIIISMLLPCVPSLVAPYLGDILEIFIQMATYLVYKPASLPDILTLHLQIGVYILYHRLYAMYPNNFLSYIRSCFASKSNDPVFRNVIQPMSQFVKFHPGLILDTLKSETETTKWRTFQPHDIFAECQKISLDPLDAVKEATYTVFSHQEPSLAGVTPRKELVCSPGAISIDINKRRESVGSKPGPSERSQPHDEQGRNDLITRTDPASYLSSQELSILWSPSFLCGLSTPPSSRTLSPANSAQDILSLNEFVQRPMTPVADTDKDLNCDNSDTRTSTPDTSRRKSGGDMKKLAQRSHKSPQLFAKSKSEESVEAKAKRPQQQESSKGEFSSESTKLTGDRGVARSSPKKKKDRETLSTLEKSSPALSRSDNAVTSKQTHSAPTTPAITSKDSFSFSSTQDNQPELASSDYQNKSSTYSVSSQHHESKRHALSFQTSTVSQFSLDSPIHELKSNVSLLRLIKDLHQEALSKMNVQWSQNPDVLDNPEFATRSKLKSPLELLDEFIECGSNLHSLQLSRIPITSQFDTDWTYYGGTTPVDELSILKNQVNLFEVQLQYERYKCDQHVLRNRRLVGKVHNAQGLEDELNGLRGQIVLLESQLSEAKCSLKQKDEVNRRLQELYRTSENEQKEVLERFSEENEKLRCKVEELVDELANTDIQLTNVVQELKSVQHELFDKTSELARIKPRLEVNETVKAKADDLAKALVSYQEKYVRIKRQFQNFEASYIGAEESHIEIASLRSEIREHKVEREYLATSLDAAKARIVELEGLLTKKEISIRDMKSSVEHVHQKHADEIKILEERYKCLKKATQGMESYILHLFTKMEESGRDLRHHGHTDNRRRAGRHDGHGYNHNNRSHGDQSMLEQSGRLHQQGLSHVADHVEGGIEDVMKDIDEGSIRVLPTRKPNKDDRTYLDKENQSVSLDVAEDYDVLREDRIHKDWTCSQTRTGIHDHKNDGEKHVNDSGIESSGVL